MHDRLDDYRHDRHNTLERGVNETSSIQDCLSRGKSLQPSDHSHQRQQRLSQHLHKVVEDVRTFTNPVFMSDPCLGPSHITNKTVSFQIPFSNEWMETNTRGKWNSLDK